MPLRRADRLGARHSKSGKPPHHQGTGPRAGDRRCRRGNASDVAIAMELGADAVLLNTAIAGASDP
jgi:hypothetical protein